MRRKLDNTKEYYHYMYKVGCAKNIRNWIERYEENRKWRQAILIRDECTCTECGAEGQWDQKDISKGQVRIEVDHIVPVTYLIKKNKITQALQALVCPEFWDINNGRVLCLPCHKKTPTYGRQAGKYRPRKKRIQSVQPPCFPPRPLRSILSRHRQLTP